MTITLEIPERVLEKLQEKADLEGGTLEEVALEILIAQTGSEDPETRVEVHSKLCEKYLAEAERLLSEHDYIQAGEKAWGAASQMLKALAAKRGLKLRSHEALHEYLSKVCEESGEAELDRLWGSATTLHQNFYEAWLPPEMVKRRVEDVKQLVRNLRQLEEI
jgi:uncharacterized protein (UPF0332 family)